jgi:hypothetical protein
MEKVRWYERAPGNSSAMRIVVMLCAVTGCVAVLSGIAGMFLLISESVAIAGVGAGMAGLGEVAKAWQAQKE